VDGRETESDEYRVEMKSSFISLAVCIEWVVAQMGSDVDPECSRLVILRFNRAAMSSADCRDVGFRGSMDQSGSGRNGWNVDRRVESLWNACGFVG
jgi:hypothetical protein